MSKKFAGPVSKALPNQCKTGYSNENGLALSASAIQYAARLLPVPHGIIRRPRAALSRMK